MQKTKEFIYVECSYNQKLMVGRLPINADAKLAVEYFKCCFKLSGDFMLIARDTMSEIVSNIRGLQPDKMRETSTHSMILITIVKNPNQLYPITYIDNKLDKNELLENPKHIIDSVYYQSDKTEKWVLLTDYKLLNKKIKVISEDLKIFQENLTIVESQIKEIYNLAIEKLKKEKLILKPKGNDLKTFKVKSYRAKSHNHNN